MTLDTEQIVMITASQLQEFATAIVRQTIAELQESPAKNLLATPEREYRYGMRGICELFGVCHSTAWQYKNTFLKPAIEQRGRKFRIDVELAQKLYNEHQRQ